MDKEFIEKLKKQLTENQYNVCVNKATERPFTGELLNEKRNGKFLCVCCGAELFSSEHKFDSGSGWPSFFEAKASSIGEVEDLSIGMKRVEIVCQNCKSHLGHVFDDGPLPTKLRYCVNSASLNFKEEKKDEP